MRFRSMRQLVSTGSPFEQVAGYSRAGADGPWCFVSGTTGYDYATMTIPDDISVQAENAMATIAKALGEAGFSLSDVVRVRYIVTDTAYAEPVFSVVGRWLSDIRPAATMIIAGLIRPEMKIEIEATAFRNPA